jgi:retron-type reverse transcriptase
VLQRAVAMVLEAVYEQEFLDCSYGFRPKRSPHQALDAIWRTLMERRGGWIIKIDIQQCFDTVSHSHLRNFLNRTTLNGKCLTSKAGKWENLFQSSEVKRWTRSIFA